MKPLILNGQDAVVRARRDGDVQFRYLNDKTWFWLDRQPDLLKSLSPTALRAIADAKESPDV